MVHGFTSAGLLPSQYESFCQVANLGYLNEHYIANDKWILCFLKCCQLKGTIAFTVDRIRANSFLEGISYIVYNEFRYCEAVEMMVEYSFAEEIEDVKQDEAYEVDGEVANIYKIIFFLIPWWYIK